MKQTSTGLKFRTLLLTSVSSVVLLSGCETYQNIKSNFFNIRPPQQVEGERRMPMLNTRYAGYGDPSAPQAPAASPHAMRAPAAQVAPTAPSAAASAPTPYDLYHGQSNDVKPPQVAPAVAAPAPVAPQPVAQPAQQPEQGGFFSRMFSGSNSDSQKPAVRKQFPGNPVHSKHTEAAAPVPQGPLEPPVDGAVPLGEAAGDVKLVPPAVPDPSAPLLDKQSSVQTPSVKPASDAPWWQRPASSQQKAADVIEPKEELRAPVIQQAQPAPEAAEAPAEEASAPVMGAKPLVMAEPEKTQPMPSSQPAPQEAQQADVIPFDYQPQEPGEEITVSKLSDKKNKPQPNWFERNFGGSSKKTEPAKPRSDAQIITTAPVVYESKPASKGNELTTKADSAKQEQVYAAATPEQAPSKRTWFERVLGFKDDPTPEQKAPYPNVASVPQTPDTFDAIKGAKPLDMEELEAERDQAVVSKMELNSEPSGQAVAPMAESQPANPVATNPVTPAGNDAQLLGHVSDPPKVEKPEDAKSTDSKQLNTKPADNEKEDEQPSKPSSSLEPVMEQPSVAAVPPVAEPVVLKTEPAAPEVAQANTVPATAEAPKEEKSFLSSIAWPWQGKKEVVKQPEPKLAEPVAVAPEQAVAADAPVKSGLTALSWDDEQQQPTVAAAKDPVAPLVPQPAMQPVVQKAAAPAEMVVPAQTPSPAWVATSAGGTPPAAAIAPSAPDFATSEPDKALPPLAAEAPKAQAKQEEEQQAENAAATAGALPSPQLLQKVKPLPPSRYENRRKQQAQ